MEERERERSVENPLTKCAVLDHLPKKTSKPASQGAGKQVRIGKNKEARNKDVRKEVVGSFGS